MAHVLPEQLIDELKKSAARQTAREQAGDYLFIERAHFDSDFEATYAGGVDDGHTIAARSVLTALGIQW